MKKETGGSKKFINDINDEERIIKIIIKLTAIKKTNGTMREQELGWAKRGRSPESNY